jgi:hypothetical protein
MNIPRETRHAAFISVASIVLAGIALFGLRAVHPSWLSDQFDALMLSLALSVCACLLLFARRFGQAHMALGLYLLAIGGAMVVLPRLLLADYGQSDPDMLFLLSGPLYLFVGVVLVVISLLNQGHWNHSYHYLPCAAWSAHVGCSPLWLRSRSSKLGDWNRNLLRGEQICQNNST